MDSRQIGFWVGILLGSLIMFVVPISGLDETGQRTAGLACLMAIWWLTEAVPISVTALVPLVAMPILGIANMKETAAPFANPIIFLFIGGFMIALAMQKWNLHKRLALNTLIRAGGAPDRLVLGFMVGTAGLSMWVSNTATSMMMLPIGVSMVAMFPSQEDKWRLSVPLMLGIAYSANIGGMASIVGTFPNALLVAELSKNHGTEISMIQWILTSLPVAVCLIAACWFLLTKILYPLGNVVSIETQALRQQLQELGPMTREERWVAAVFAITAFLWILRPQLKPLMPAGSELSDASIAIAAALVLFLIPSRSVTSLPKEENETDDRLSKSSPHEKSSPGARILCWEDTRDVPWGLPILLGGGLSLASAMKSSGVSAAIGELMNQLSHVPLVIVIATIVATVVFLTEITSNTATTAVLLPVIGSVATTLDIDPMIILFPMTLAASCAFMLPVATPPNAIVYGSGLLHARHMRNTGLWLNLFSIVVLTIFGATLAAFRG